MNILLIGKFPPLQGGVAARYYWLYKALAKSHAQNFQVITVCKPPFLIPIQNNNTDIHVTRIEIEDKNTPWFIPKSGLLTERIVNAAARTINCQKIDLIECNYLMPFLTPSTLISALYDIPLLIRPAGSDYHKFLRHPMFRELIERCLSRATRILLPSERVEDFKSKFPTINSAHILTTPRYIPDPRIFYPRPPPQVAKRKILFVGKINQFWKLRGIDSLIYFLEKNDNYIAKFIVDGTHIDEFIRYLNSKPCISQIQIHQGFVSPQNMPSEIADSFAVWNVTLPGGIPDFPNTHWETIFSGRISVISSSQLHHPDISETPHELKSLIVNVDDLLSANFSFPLPATYNDARVHDAENMSFGRYLNFHQELYKGIL